MLAVLRELAELVDVLLGDAQLHGLACRPGIWIASATWRRPSAVAVATARIACACALGLVDLLLPLRLRRLDHLLLLALGGVDRGVALALPSEDHGALLALGAHLLLHRGEHVLRRRDVLDLVAQHLDAPRLGRLVELGDDRGVDVRALLEGAVEVDLADLAAQRRLRELGDGEHVVRDAVGGALAGRAPSGRARRRRATWTLSRVMQTCSGMSIACSLSEWR